MKKVYAMAGGWGFAIRGGELPFKGRYFYYKVRRLFRKWRDTKGMIVELPPFKKVRNRTFWEGKQEYNFYLGGEEYTLTAYQRGAVYLKKGVKDFFPADGEVIWTGGCRPVY